MTPKKVPLGKIHSFESFGTLDGPGIRFVVFFAGCPLRCKFCHNIDIVHAKEPMELTANEILKQILRDRPYMDASCGGVTVSGGDPFSQPEFLADFLRKCKESQLHTAVDTSLCAPAKFIPIIAEHTDLFLISLKHFDDKVHRYLTGGSNHLILNNIRLVSELQKRIWFRLLILPGYTDTKANLTALAAFLRTVNFELIELLPYHRMGVYKWNELGLSYELNGVKLPSTTEIRHVQKFLTDRGFKAVVNE